MEIAITSENKTKKRFPEKENICLTFLISKCICKSFLVRQVKPHTKKHYFPSSSNCYLLNWIRVNRENGKTYFISQRVKQQRSIIEGSSNIPWKPFNLWTKLERGSRVEYFFLSFRCLNQQRRRNKVIEHDYVPNAFLLERKSFSRKTEDCHP